MKKRTRAILVGINVITGASSLLLYYAASKFNASTKSINKTNELIRLAWEEVIDETTHDLKLNKKPSLNIDTTIEPLALCTHNEFYNHFKVVRTEAIYEVKVNPVVMNKMFRRYLLTFGVGGASFRKDFVTAILRHELRHIWQAQNNFYVGNPQFSLNFDFNGYGNKKEELDANTYSCDTAKNKSQLVVAQLNKLEQENINKLISTSNGLGVLKATTDLYKVYPPIASLFM